MLMGFGTGFIFVPLTTLSVGTLRNDQIGSATGIQNLMRNVGGSVGISWVSTMLARYAQAHQAFMVGHVSPLDPAYQAQAGRDAKVFAAHFSPAGCAAAGAGVHLQYGQSSRPIIGLMWMRFIC